MGVKDIIGVSFILGVAVCYGLLAKGIIMKYRVFIKEFNDAEKYKKEINGKIVLIKRFENANLNLIVKEFIKSAQDETEDINTEVIIEKNVLKEKFLNLESFVDGGAAICIALGLLGTFFGLTGAIGQVKDVIASGTGGINDFVSGMQGPIGSMSLAFYTTIAGVVCSVVLNFIVTVMKNEKENFYNLVEDYLDNYIYCKCKKTDNEIIVENLENSLEAIIDCLDDKLSILMVNIQNTLDTGFRSLQNGIEKNNIDLTKTTDALVESANVMATVGDTLNSTIDTLNFTIDNLRAPVDYFTSSVQKFGEHNIKFNNNLERNLSTFENSIIKQEESFVKLKDSIEGSSNQNKELKTVIRKELEHIKAVDSHFKEMTENLNKSFEKQDKLFNEFPKSIESLEKIVPNFIKALNDKSAEDKASFTNTINESLDNMSGKFVKDIDKSVVDLKDMASKNNEVQQELLKSVISLGGYVASIEDSKNSEDIFEYTIERHEVGGKHES